MFSDTHPVAVLKYCPRCGSSSFRAVSDRSFKCDHCSFHYFVNASAAVAILLFNEKGELLLTRRAIEPHLGKLDLPGGFVDPMESAEEAAVREIREELGISIHSLCYFGSFPNEYVFSGYTVLTIDLAFFAKTEELDQIRPMDDVASVEFHRLTTIDPEEMPSFSMYNIIKELIKREGTY